MTAKTRTLIWAKVGSLGIEFAEVKLTSSTLRAVGVAIGSGSWWTTRGSPADSHRPPLLPARPRLGSSSVQISPNGCLIGTKLDFRTLSGAEALGRHDPGDSREHAAATYFATDDPVELASVRAGVFSSNVEGALIVAGILPMTVDAMQSGSDTGPLDGLGNVGANALGSLAGAWDATRDTIGNGFGWLGGVLPDLPSVGLDPNGPIARQARGEPINPLDWSRG